MPTSCDFSALAVVPSALGPLQALITILPHLLVILGTALLAVLKPTTYRTLLKYFWTHKVLTLLCITPFLLFFFGGRLLGARAVDEQQGSAWLAFRGGPERTGAVAGARGPFENARVLWNYVPSGTGAVQAIDSSPTVVGNRVYFGTSRQTPISKSGTITCLDTVSGALVWQFTGEGMDTPLAPIFSSPALGSTQEDIKNGDETRYLISGEGYHDDVNSRIFCLDLAPVRRSGGKQPPELKWALQTTSHVEASPAIFENKVYAGTGDDGWWCIDLETGNLKWRVEGVESYIINEGPQAEALSKLAGKTVAVNGSATRYRPDKSKKDFSILFLNATTFAEVPEGTTMAPALAQPLPPSNARTVIGKVVITEAVNIPEQNGSRVKLVMEKFYPDAECPPVALRIDGQPRLICGSGLDGQSVICLNAETGEEIWRTPTSDPVFSAPTFFDGQILVGLSNGTYVASHVNPAGAVLALSATDGKQLWQYKTTDGVLGAVAVRDGKAYACSRDGSVYVLDAKAGTLLRKFDTGAAMVCSPVVTDVGVYVSTGSGKVFGIKRDTVGYQWSLNLTPSQGILSSACAAGDRLFVGSATRGFFCIAEEKGLATIRKAASPWTGNGGSAARCNVADDRGPPTVDGNKADRIPETIPTAAHAQGRTAACGTKLYFAAMKDGKPALTCVDPAKRTDAWQQQMKSAVLAITATESSIYVLCESGELTAHDAANGKQLWSRETVSTGPRFLSLSGQQLIVKKSNTEIIAIDVSTSKERWTSAVGETVGEPALQHGLLLLTTKSPQPQLICMDDSTGSRLWTVDVGAEPLGGPSLFGCRVVFARKSNDGAMIVCKQLSDGGPMWQTAIEKEPVTPLAINSSHVAFTVADGKVLVLETTKGEQTHTVPLGKGGQAPILYQDMLFLGAENRIGAYGLTDSTWIWTYRDQKTVGRMLGAPLLIGEAVWYSTEKSGLIAIGGKAEKK